MAGCMDAVAQLHQQPPVASARPHTVHVLKTKPCETLTLNEKKA